MKSAVPEISCKPRGRRLMMKCSSLHSRQWLRVVQGLTITRLPAPLLLTAAN